MHLDFQAQPWPHGIWKHMAVKIWTCPRELSVFGCKGPPACWPP